jgi:hypothetical protein
MATIGLRQIVAQFLDSADQSSHQFRRMYNIGVRGSRAFNLDITGTMITALLPVNVNNTVNLPVDYLTYSKMGIINERGEIITLAKMRINKAYASELTAKKRSLTGLTAKA